MSVRRQGLVQVDGQMKTSIRHKSQISTVVDVCSPARGLAHSRFAHLTLLSLTLVAASSSVVAYFSPSRYFVSLSFASLCQRS